MKYSFGMLSLYVQDMERAKAFYTEFLGMTVIPAFSNPSFVFLQPAEGTPIALQDIATLPSGVPGQTGGFEINLEVEDVKQAFQAWKAKGAELLTDITDMGAGLYFRGKDTEGNIVCPYQMYPEVKAMSQ